jgi:hypothetical protein
MEQKKNRCGICAAHIGIGLCIIAAVTAVVMVLWNVLIPAITGWTAINYWQALGIVVLGHLITSGHKGGPCHGHHGSHGHHGHCCSSHEKPEDPEAAA